MTVDVLAKGVDPSDAKISIRPAHLKVIIKKDKKDVLVLDTPLFARIIVEDSRMRYMSSKVRIVLPKAVAESWPTLEGQAAPATATSNMAAASASAVPAALPQASSVPRPYASHRDWETIERQLQQVGFVCFATRRVIHSTHSLFPKRRRKMKSQKGMKLSINSSGIFTPKRTKTRDERW